MINVQVKPNIDKVAIQQLLRLLEGANKDVESNIDTELKTGSGKVMVRQYQYLKYDYSTQLYEYLQKYGLPIEMEAMKLMSL